MMCVAVISKSTAITLGAIDVYVTLNTPTKPNVVRGKPRGHQVPNFNRRRAPWHLGDASQSSKDGRRKHGSIGHVAKRFNCDTVSKVWKSWEKTRDVDAAELLLTSKKKGRCGAKPKRTSIEIETAIKRLKMHQRQTSRSLAHNCGIPKTTIFRHMKKEGRLKRASSRLRPLLTEVNMKARLEFAISFVKVDRVFVDMHDVVDVDEKWFYLTKVNGKFYVYDEEELPLRATKSKNFITKVMFLAAFARPRYDQATNQFFDGKLGMWPFVIQEPAKRTSKNRARGTLITTPISVTSEVYFDMLVSNVLPAIKRKMSFLKNSKIFIQQDNAGPHSKSVNYRFNQVGSYDGWNVALKNQPANSPDFNLLDLGFFNSIQSLQCC
ncbi:hypothetical protein LEN26_013915 [Aphanomyces euteiches]|nr:hypothetical protein LEN26_013915 [Aphanomyces euteiches]